MPIEIHEKFSDDLAGDWCDGRFSPSNKEVHHRIIELVDNFIQDYKED